MQRIIRLITAALLALLIFAPAAVAQEDMMQDESMMMEEQSKMEQPKMMEEPKMMEKGNMEEPKMMEMPKTGGPSLGLLLLPAAVLLVGTGVMGAYLRVVRRRG